MQRRLFVGISIPDDVKKRIFRVVEKEFKNLKLAWTAKENYHITLNFLGYMLEERIPEICDAVREATREQNGFELDFLRLEAGPSEKSKRLIWITGKENEELNKLKSRLDYNLGSAFAQRRKYVPHITLARIKRGSGGLSRPGLDIEREVNFIVPVCSLELFESKYEKGRRTYYVLESFPLT